jgi:glycerophosphoryl diester phosphodiesterase
VTQRGNPWLARTRLCIAHQGGELEAPSSTLYAMRRAVALGADALELDVHATADGHLVVLHDPTVDRTTNGAGQRLDAAHWFVPDEGIVHGYPDDGYPLRGIATGAVEPPAGTTAGDFTIPSLAEVFEAFPSTLINLDIKATAPEVSPYETLLADCIAAHDRIDSTMVASFHDAALRSYRAYAPQAWTSAGPEEVLAFWEAVAAGRADNVPIDYAALQVPRTYGDVVVVTPELVAAAHRAGVAVHVWTIDDEPTMRELLALPVEGVVTNRPTLLQAVLVD